MKRRLPVLTVLCTTIILVFSSGYPQENTQTILDMRVLQSLINETSGALQMHHIIEMGGYPRDRQAEEYASTYFETQYIFDKASEYGFSDVRIERWPSSSPLWDGQAGELWIVEPEERLVINYRDIVTALAPNSSSGEWTGELIFVGEGASESDYEGKNIKGNFVLTSASPGRMYNLAVKKYGAAGIISYGVINNFFEFPDKITWNSLPTGRGFPGMGAQDTTPPPKAFGFNVSPRIGDDLRRKLAYLPRNGKISMKAIVKATEREVDNELVTALIPGDGSTDEEIVLTAHLFEGIHKQGALDNHSGCASILEAGRTLIKLMDEGKISRPARNLRFLWVPEISGTFLYLIRFPEETKKMIANINLDMVGENIHKNLNSLRLYQNLKSRAHCIDDIGAALFEWMGQMSLGSQPVVDPMGTITPFYFNVMPFSSGSDHIVFQMQEFKIPAAFFNNWPDMVYHTSHDRPDMADASQLKRSAILTAAIAVSIGGGKETDVVRLGSLCLGRSLDRMVQKASDELGDLAITPEENLVERFRDSKYIVQSQSEIEKQSLGSLAAIAGNDSRAKTYVSQLLTELDNGKKTAERTLDNGYGSLCARLGTKATTPAKSQIEKDMARLIPADVPKALPKEDAGEMSLFSLFMGPRVFVRGIGRNESMELRYFIDGKRSMLDIRNLVSAEFGPVPLKATKEYFEKLEEAKYLTIQKK
ncbi:MAG: M28 family peptidase [bacterium]